MKQRIAIVTGGTSGIGLAGAEALSSAGYRVYTFSRRGNEGKPSEGASGICHMAVDVTSEEAVKAAVDEIAEKEGRIDLVVNCAGFGISGAIEFTSLQDAKRLMDVDFFGTVNVNRAVIPLMRAQGMAEGGFEAGRIINISSVAGPAAIPFQAYYSCAKAAVDAYTAALANELKPFHITVCAIRPGDVKTGFTAAREKKHEGNEIYGGRIDKSVAKMEHDENVMSEAFAKLESSFAAYQSMCQKRDSLLSLTNLNRAQIPNLFVKIDRDTEAMETVFTICRLMA